MDMKARVRERDLNRIRELLGRPLLEDEAEELTRLAQRQGVTLDWQHYRLQDGWKNGWQNGRGNAV